MSVGTNSTAAPGERRLPGHVREHHDRVEASQSVTVVIPAFNEEANLARLTEQILNEPWSEYLVLDRIIIVDDCSDDSTPTIAADLAREHERVSVIRHARREGKNAGIRTGLSACQSDIIVFVDGDVYLEPGCLTKTLGLLVGDPSLAAASPLNAPLPARSWREQASRFQALLIADLWRSGHESLARVFAIKTEAIAGLDLPDDVPDDLHIMRWLRRQHCRYAACLDAVAFYRASTGFRDFAKQTIRFWRAEKASQRALPGVPLPSNRSGTIIRCLFRTIWREPLGFVQYVAWRSLIVATPRRWWAPISDASRYDTSRSTKDLGQLPRRASLARRKLGTHYLDRP